jgi:4-hydroxy-4-methyl-2-oxoglutarate aldolase
MSANSKGPLGAAPAGVAAFLAAQPTGITVDGMAKLGAFGCIDSVRAMGGRRRISGRARTMLYARGRGHDVLSHSVYAVIRSLDPGDVLVVATQAADRWFLGENMTHEALYHGLGGIITDGCVRDSDELAEMDFGVFARGVAVSPPNPDYALYAIDVPVVLAGTLVAPGDIIHADADGAVVVPHALAGRLVQQAQELAKVELRQEEAIRNRVSLEDLGKILDLKKSSAK